MTLQKLQEDLHVLGMKIKHHEDNIKFLKSHKNKLDDSILDLQGILNFLFSTHSSWILKYKILLGLWKAGEKA
jgi:hypothetical protein